MSDEEEYDAFLAAVDQSIRERMMRAGWATASAEDEIGVALRLTPNGLETLKRLSTIFEELDGELSDAEAVAFYHIIKAQSGR